MSSGVNELIAHRWSPRAFLDRKIDAEDLHGLFEAARWAASCFNEQPWRFVTATKADPAAFAKVLGLLVEKNREWAKTAYVLGFSAGKKTFTHSGAPDRYGLYDTGAAMANLAIEATARGIHVHFMGGFDIARARTEFAVPEDFEIGAAFAIGYIEKTTESGPRTRKPLTELVFGGEWGKTADFVSAWLFGRNAGETPTHTPKISRLQTLCEWAFGLRLTLSVGPQSVFVNNVDRSSTVTASLTTGDFRAATVRERDLRPTAEI